MKKPTYKRLSPTQDRRRRLSESDIRKIRQLRAAGRSARSIAPDFGVHYSTIEYWTGSAERRNARRVENLKRTPVDPEVQRERRERHNEHYAAVMGEEAVRKFRREYRRATRHLHKDYRTTCQNLACAGRKQNKQGYFYGYRYSSRLHEVCPICKTKN